MLSDLHSLVVLNNLKGIGPVRTKLLVEHFGAPSSILKASQEALTEVKGLGKQTAQQISQWKQSSLWEQDLELIERFQVQLLSFQDPRFPRALKALASGPVLLYVMGELLPQDQAPIAIVGTRNPSIYGQEMAEKFGREVASSGTTVISGLARGVDGAAHLGALSRGRTLAVIGSGLGNLYPKENAPLARKMVERGAVVSEFPMATPPDRQNFPQRNRIVSGWSRGVLLIEAPLKSGAMLTMELAKKQGKKRFAIPGRIDWDSFAGNHALIRSGEAHFVTSGGEILDHFEGLFPQPTPASQKLSLDPNEHILYNVLKEQERSIDELATLLQLPITQLNVLIMGLVLKKAIKEYPGKIYKSLE